MSGTPRYRELRTLTLRMARKAAAASKPTQIGSVRFYDVQYGWNTIVLRDDPEVSLARTSFDLQAMLKDPQVQMILVPHVSTLARSLAVRICSECDQAKTVYFETGPDEANPTG